MKKQKLFKQNDDDYTQNYDNFYNHERKEQKTKSREKKKFT